MSGNFEATTASSSDSGHGSAPLSEPFVAVTVEGHSRQDLGNRVVVPEGAAQLHVRRSARVASSRSRSAFTAASNLPAAEFVDAPPGGKRKIGFRYQVLPPVMEDVGHASGSLVPVGNGGGLRDAANPQLVSVAPTVVPTGRKRSASGAAPGSARRGPAPRPLASAADFSPTHFEEPRSDELPPAHQPSAMFFRGSAPPSPMVVEQDDPSPPSSPISQNPLLQQEASTIIHTPPSSRRSPRLFRTRDSTTAWVVAEGLRPIGEGFTAPGYVPAQLVGGVSYTVGSPQGRSPPVAQQAYSGRRLFSEYGDRQQQAPIRSLQPAAADHITEDHLQPQLPSHVCRYDSCYRAYMLTLP